MYLIGLTGRKSSGKSEVGRFLARDRGWQLHAFSQPLKDALSVMFGWSLEKLDSDFAWKERLDPRLGFSPRKAMQTLGTEWGRNLSPTLWVDLARHHANFHFNLFPSIPLIFTDLRFDNEAEWVRSCGGQVVRILRPGLVAGKDEHASEKGVTDSLVSFSLSNEGTLPDLYRKVTSLCTKFTPVKLDAILPSKPGSAPQSGTPSRS